MLSYEKYTTQQGQKWMFKMLVSINPETGRRKIITQRGFRTKMEAQLAASHLNKN